MTSEETAKYFEELIECADFVDASYTDCVKVEAIRTAFEALKERKTSRWFLTEIHNCYDVYKCVECERKITVFHRYGDAPTKAKVTEDYPYCHCGAKMEVDE